MALGLVLVLVRVIIITALDTTEIPATSISYTDGGADAQLLTTLLSGHIRQASCEARCGAADTAEDRSRCLEVCTMGAGAAEICKYVWLCGQGCSLACRPPAEEPRSGQRRLLALAQDGCQADWEMHSDKEEEHLGAVVYIVAGRDNSGMWSMLAPLLHHTSTLLSSTQVNRYAALAVMAITADGVADIAMMPLKAVANCGGNGISSALPTVHIVHPLVSLSAESSYAWLLAALLLFLTIIIMCGLMASRCGLHTRLPTAQPEEDYRPIIKPTARINIDKLFPPV
jgi:hypothetical protein